MAPIAELGTWTWRREVKMAAHWGTATRCSVMRRLMRPADKSEADNDALTKTIQLPCLCLTSMRRVSACRRVGEFDAAKIESRDAMRLDTLRGLAQCLLTVCDVLHAPYRVSSSCRLDDLTPFSVLSTVTPESQAFVFTSVSSSHNTFNAKLPF